MGNTATGRGALFTEKSDPFRKFGSDDSNL
jgi:hypothetical protein